MQEQESNDIKKSVFAKATADKHTCKAAVLHCIDFRFQQVMNGHFDAQFPEGYDVISVAGAVKGLVEKGDDRDYLLYQIKISHDLHHPQDIVLIQHEDCGAYGGSKNFGSSEKEFEFQKNQLQQAQILLKDLFSDCVIQKYFVKLSGDIIQV